MVPTATGVLISAIAGDDVVMQNYVTTLSSAAKRVCAIAGRDLTSSEWATYLPAQARTPLCGAAG